MWSLAQQFAYRRISTPANDQAPQNRAVYTDYVQRARIIAATYARFYLEQEDQGDISKKGRYYWMALAAFASKTVACSLDGNAGSIEDVREGLGKGNFWVFQDIAPIHWYCNHSFDTFKQCEDVRSKKNCLPAVLNNLQKLPWAKSALNEVDHFKISTEMKLAIYLANNLELKTKIEDRQKTQLQSLILTAEHEQTLLQKLIYENKNFTRFLKLQRKYPAYSPKLRIVFTHECSTDDEKLESVAGDEIIIENYDSRMKWIVEVAKKFHNLMIEKKIFMENELKTIASNGDISGFFTEKITHIKNK